MSMSGSSIALSTTSSKSLRLIMERVGLSDSTPATQLRTIRGGHKVTIRSAGVFMMMMSLLIMMMVGTTTMLMTVLVVIWVDSTTTTVHFRKDSECSIWVVVCCCAMNTGLLEIKMVFTLSIEQQALQNHSPSESCPKNSIWKSRTKNDDRALFHDFNRVLWLTS